MPDMNSLYAGYREATRGLETQAASERERVNREYDTQRSELQQQLGESERDVQRELGRLRTAERREQRRADLPMSRPRDIGTTEKLASVRQQGEGIRQSIRETQAKVEQARGESVADLRRQVAEGKGKLREWYREARAAEQAANKAARIAAKAEARAATVAPAYDDAAEYYREYAPKAAGPFAGAKAKGQTSAQINPFAGATARGKVGAQLTVPTSVIGAPLSGKQRELAEKSQTELRAEYDTYKALPWWQKLYTDVPVVKAKNGAYVPLVTGYAPAVAPAQKATGAVRQAAKLSPSLKAELGSIVDDVIARTKGSIFNTIPPPSFRYGAAGAVKLSAAQLKQIKALNDVLLRAAKNQPAIAVNARAGTVRLTANARNLLRSATRVSAATATGVVSALGLQAAVDASARGMTMPQIRQATQAAIQQMANVAPRAMSQASVQAATQQALRNLAKVQAQSVVAVSAKVSGKTSTKSVPDIQLEPLTKPLEKTDTTTKTDTPVKPSTPQVSTKITTPTRPPEPPSKGPPPPVPVLDLPDGTKVRLTRKQYAGIVAWRQGLFYIIIYPPYGKAQTIYTRKPVPGILYARGPQSPQRSAAVVGGGKLPRSFEVAMGIAKVRVTPGAKARPTLTFRSVKVTPELGELRRSKKHGR
jgi:hypothetical protein